MDQDTLRLIISVIGAVTAGLVGALVAGLLSRAASERSISAAQAQADRQAEQQRQLEHQQWLRNQKQIAYQSFVAAVDSALTEWQDAGRNGFAATLTSSRSAVRLVGSVEARRCAAAVSAELALLRALSIVGAEGQRDAREKVSAAFLRFITAARYDLGAATDDDAFLGKVEIPQSAPEVMKLARTYLQSGGGGGAEEEEG